MKTAVQRVGLSSKCSKMKRGLLRRRMRKPRLTKSELNGDNVLWLPLPEISQCGCQTSNNFLHLESSTFSAIFPMGQFPTKPKLELCRLFQRSHRNNLWVAGHVVILYQYFENYQELTNWQIFEFESKTSCQLGATPLHCFHGLVSQGLSASCPNNNNNDNDSMNVISV